MATPPAILDIGRQPTHLECRGNSGGLPSSPNVDGKHNDFRKPMDRFSPRDHGRT
jgi:hypothetical protein